MEWPLRDGREEPVYLDHNATTPLREEAREAVTEAAARFGNPSSVHHFGREARAIVEDAREAVAALIGAEPAEIVFTSGGTEADALAVHQIPPGCQVLASAVEHPAVRDNLRRREDVDLVWLPVDGTGVVDDGAFADALAALDPDRPVFVVVMLANNETGVVQPVAQLVTLARAAHGRVLGFSDAVQAAGKLPVDVGGLGVHYLALSAHKIGGPKGVGALWLHPEAPFAPLWRGGGQERRLRTGTENVIGIAGFGAAARAVGRRMEEEARRLARLRGRLEDGLRALRPDVVILGADAPRVPNTTLFAVPGTRAEVLVMRFDLAGVAVSTGAACSSGRTEPSHVVAAMTADPAIREAAVRVSLGWSTSEDDIDRFLAAAREILGVGAPTDPVAP
ncbi:MAG: cysteine desulfurase [Rhodothalassiaceae bacterium]|nr:MAG: cysteine desulfurase [Rhodothalassiaceae bacterium]